MGPAHAEPESQHLGAPLYVAWQITNECNLACMHCIEESGPGKKFKDELGEAQVFSVLEQMMALEIPYLSFSGGEPMLHPHFFEMVDYVCSRGSQLKVETNGHFLTPETAARLRDLGVKAVQVSLDGGSRATFNKIRVLGEFDRVLEGIRHLRDAGVPIEINFSPTRFNIHEIAGVVDLAYELGAYSFYTGRTMYTGNAVKAWRHLEVAGRRTTKSSSTRCAPRRRSTRAACASTSTKPVCWRSSATAWRSPPRCSSCCRTGS